MICFETIAEGSVCSSCQKKFLVHRKVYFINGIRWYVLYEYNEFLERLFFQYKEQCDVALCSAFLSLFKEDIRKLTNHHTVCGLCSSQQKSLRRGFEPLELIFSSMGVNVYFPLYKTSDVKQSQQSKEDRKKIHQIIQKKDLYCMPTRDILLVDDVCTTGNSMSRAAELLEPKAIFLISAHPLWIQEHEQNLVVKHQGIW